MKKEPIVPKMSRTEVIRLRVTPREKQLLVRHANMAGLSVSCFIRAMLEKAHAGPEWQQTEL